MESVVRNGNKKIKKSERSFNWDGERPGVYVHFPVEVGGMELDQKYGSRYCRIELVEELGFSVYILVVLALWAVLWV